LYAALV